MSLLEELCSSQEQVIVANTITTGTAQEIVE